MRPGKVAGRSQNGPVAAPKQALYRQRSGVQASRLPAHSAARCSTPSPGANEMSPGKLLVCGCVAKSSSVASTLSHAPILLPG